MRVPHKVITRSGSLTPKPQSCERWGACEAYESEEEPLLIFCFLVLIKDTFFLKQHSMELKGGLEVAMKV